MATTTNYGWTTPDDTSLVKDGASAIRTLGSSIDTSLNNALGTKKAGLVLLNTTSFSAVSQQNVSSCFSATYKNYKIIVSLDSSSASDYVVINLRTGSTNASSGYAYANWKVNSGGTASVDATSTTGTSLVIGRNDTAGSSISEIILKSPFETKKTVMFGTSNYHDATNNTLMLHSGVLKNDTSYESISLNANAGNLTGRISVYGFNE
jgi:hypothetical protein